MSLVGGFFPVLHLDFVLFPALCITCVCYILQPVLLICVRLYPSVFVRWRDFPAHGGSPVLGPELITEWGFHYISWFNMISIVIFYLKNRKLNLVFCGLQVLFRESLMSLLPVNVTHSSLPLWLIFITENLRDRDHFHNPPFNQHLLPKLILWTWDTHFFQCAILKVSMETSSKEQFYLLLHLTFFLSVGHSRDTKQLE